MSSAVVACACDGSLEPDACDCGGAFAVVFFASGVLGTSAALLPLAAPPPSFDDDDDWDCDAYMLLGNSLCISL